MGILLDYAKMRVEDIGREIEVFVRNPVDYILSKQTLRKALLLEWLDNVRPVVGTKYEHWVQELKRR
ncbi:MAG: hypothetical protein QXR44_03185 [Thermoproteota archaeon]